MNSLVTALSRGSCGTSTCGQMLHLWGPNADDSPQQAASTILSMAGATEGERVDVVFVPSYWGDARREILAGNLKNSGREIIVSDPAQVLLALQGPTVSYCILVEVEPDRICVSSMDYEAAQVHSTIVHTSMMKSLDIRVETLIAVAHQLSTNPAAGIDPIDGAPIDSLRGITNYPQSWVDSVEFVVAEASQPEFRAATSREEPLLSALRRRGFLAYHFPFAELDSFVSSSANQRAQALGRPNQSVIEQSELPDLDCADPGAVDSEPGECESSLRMKDVDSKQSQPALAVAQIRQRLQKPGREELGEQRSSRREARNLEPARVLAGALAVVAIAGVVSGATFLAGQRQDIDFAAASAGAADSGEKSSGAVSSTPSYGAQNSPEATIVEDTIVAESGQFDDGTIRFEGAGVATKAPKHFLQDFSNAEDRLVLYDGDRMRLILMSHPVSAEVTLDEIEARMTAQSLEGGAMSNARRTRVGEVDVVTMEERLPSGRSVALWHYRVIDGRQISIGCQYRGHSIPDTRSDCETAVLNVENIH